MKDGLVDNGAVNHAGVVAHPGPPGEPVSGLYSVTAGGVCVPVYCCRVSAVPLNQVWPGYQRPVDQTEPAAFACCDVRGPVSVSVTAARQVESVAVRPSSTGIAPAVEGRRIDFTVPGPCHLTVEVNGWHKALHLFISPPEESPPSADAPNVRYFGPGVHRPGKIIMESGQTVYVAGGAVVHGSIQAKNARDLRILGRGIIDVSGFERGEGGGAIRLEDCEDVTIDGLVLRDPDVWCCSLFGCRNAQISDLKLVGLWRYNADGIDLCNSRDIHIRDCFVRAFDDCIVLKGLNWAGGPKARDSYHEQPVRNITVERCVIWNDWGRALEIGAETSAPQIADVVFRDCDIIRTAHIAMDIQHGDRAVVRDIRFENIRVEYDDFNLRPRMQQVRDETYVMDEGDDYRPHLMYIVIQPNHYSRDKQLGVVRNVVFKDISATSRLFPPSHLRGADAAHDVAGVTIDNLLVNGQRCADAEAAHMEVHPHVSDVAFQRAPAGQ